MIWYLILQLQNLQLLLLNRFEMLNITFETDFFSVENEI